MTEEVLSIPSPKENRVNGWNCLNYRVANDVVNISYLFHFL